jgi:hypothetical protein
LISNEVQPGLVGAALAANVVAESERSRLKPLLQRTARQAAEFHW